ncbi:MAG: MBL fold metallo-hydrolase [Theionarchaea archaeon]|nr:MBL fold metallo-hydrolase [Theionarchaea archaeon]
MNSSITTDSTPLSLADLTIAVVYDNNVYDTSVISEWGFSCYISGGGHTLLFDTGGKGPLLRHNMETMGLKLTDVESVVISHHHGDHTGGLSALLRQKETLTLYIPQSFPSSFTNHVQGYGARVVSVSEPVSICDNIYSTGEMGRGTGTGTGIREQSLFMRTDGGAIVITGCAHPGIIQVVKQVRTLCTDPILLLMGGFHLSADHVELTTQATALKHLDVVHVGPCHCSGDAARDVFKTEFGDRYIEMGAGRIITAETFTSL